MGDQGAAVVHYLLDQEALVIHRLLPQVKAVMVGLAFSLVMIMLVAVVEVRLQVALMVLPL
jgi:hypothetical protein